MYDSPEISTQVSPGYSIYSEEIFSYIYYIQIFPGEIMTITHLKQMIEEEMKTTMIKDEPLFFPKEYEIEDFQIGMLIEAIIDDETYKITAGEAYEIINVYKLRDPNFGIVKSIQFINDKGFKEIKMINHTEYPFDKYFKIL